MSDSDSDDGRVAEEILPPHQIRFNDMVPALFKKVLKRKHSGTRLSQEQAVHRSIDRSIGKCN